MTAGVVLSVRSIDVHRIDRTSCPALTRLARRPVLRLALRELCRHFAVACVLAFFSNVTAGHRSPPVLNQPQRLVRLGSLSLLPGRGFPLVPAPRFPSPRVSSRSSCDALARTS